MFLTKVKDLFEKCDIYESGNHFQSPGSIPEWEFSFLPGLNYLGSPWLPGLALVLLSTPFFPRTQQSTAGESMRVGGRAAFQPGLDDGEAVPWGDLLRSVPCVTV